MFYFLVSLKNFSQLLIIKISWGSLYFLQLEIPFFSRLGERKYGLLQHPAFDSTLCAKPEVYKLGYVLPWDTQRLSQGNPGKDCLKGINFYTLRFPLYSPKTGLPKNAPPSHVDPPPSSPFYNHLSTFTKERHTSHHMVSSQDVLNLEKHLRQRDNLKYYVDVDTINGFLDLSINMIASSFQAFASNTTKGGPN